MISKELAEKATSAAIDFNKWADSQEKFCSWSCSVQFSRFDSLLSIHSGSDHHYYCYSQCNGEPKTHKQNVNDFISKLNDIKKAHCV